MTELTIEKLIFGGQGLAHTDDKTVFVWNALPGERVQVPQIHKHKGIFEATAEQIVAPSTHRIEPREAHFGSCSPWQIMDYGYEQEQKLAIARETYQHIGKFDWPELTIVNPDERFDYRTKIEFSFYVDDETGELSLAFFNRGSKRPRPIAGCALALPAINQVAQDVLNWIRTTSLTKRNLKTLLVRANSQGQVLAALFIKDRLDLGSLPPLGNGLAGFMLIYSTHKSPASVVTEVLATSGSTKLAETIGGVELSYGLQSFFQIYPAIFEAALVNIATHVPGNRPLLDFYAGVGSIGLPLASHVPSVSLVESNPEAVEFAQANIGANHLTNATVHCAPAEKLTELIDAEHTLIVDPPRAGLHPAVIERILAVQPETIIYLSCNISTQARDLQLLSEVYETTELKLYNFFPATPHIEGLAVLHKRSIA